ncbi:MAG: translation initiation factor IF-2 [Spirochaetaceae bacterium]|jgi:translation initiation factor IF-2|nr:translation initiation factor IF-2 [Spirochaetaceae bacterium]
MAEKENFRPKAELIKRSKEKPENVAASPETKENPAETNDVRAQENASDLANTEAAFKKKVAVVRKKRPAARPQIKNPETVAEGGAGGVETSHHPRESDAPRKKTDAPPYDRNKRPQSFSPFKKDAFTRNSPAANNNGAEKKRPAPPSGQNPPSPFAQRPAVQVGRVGGKYIGPRPPRPEGSDYRPRPHQGQAPSGGPFTGRHGNYSRNPNVDGQRPPMAGGRPGGFNRTGGGGYGQRTGAPPPGNSSPVPSDGRTPPKRNFKVKKVVYKKNKEDSMEEKLLQTKKKSQHIANPIPKSIEIMEVISVSELARKMNLKASDLIHKLMTMGMMVSINQQIDSETAAILAGEYGCAVKIVSLYEQTVIETEKDNEDAMTPRPPVVTVMGHVDHGKTKLLDAIRSSDVVSGEFGGITQHIGAYMVETPNGNITFLDTPGHEAFTRMRARGAQITDIVVLVVAADDGVMPQTIEAVNHAKEAGVPIVVAVNKIDKPEANPDKVKSQLAEMGLTPEEWGGQTMFVHISAKKKEGIEKLIESVLLQAEILDLKSNYNRSAEGKIIESKIDQGRGIVATVMVQKGTLQIGDAFVAGIWPGKVRAIFNDKGKKILKATPAMPVEVLGFEGVSNAGDPIQVVEDEKIARSYAIKRQELKRFEDAKNVKKITLDNLYDTISDGSIAELKVIIKGDVQGSVEALRSSLEKLSTPEVRLNVIQALPGAINEGDVDLAAASNAILIGFNVRPTPKARAIAEQEKVDIRRYNIIYRVVDEMRLAMEGLLKPETKEEVLGGVEVREVFKISKSGVVAGCYVQSGSVKRSASVNVIRNDTVIYTGKIGGLRRFKDDVKEVSAGYECGISIDGFEDVKTGDELEIFETVEIARKLQTPSVKN